MAVTVVSISATAPLTAYASASPLAMAFWRNALGFATLGPFLLLLRRREAMRILRGERRPLRREQWRPIASGFLAATALSLHFASFMTSTRLTSVAMSTALVATQPLWQALIAAAQGIRTPRLTWVGLAVSVVGVAAASGVDIRSGGSALLGDCLALAGAVAQAGYTALSARARASLSTPLYSTLSSFVCAVELLLVCHLAHISLTDLDRSTRLSLLGLLVLPQLLGLGSLNFVLGRLSATTISVVLLLETPVAAVGAWWLIGQQLDPGTMPGLVLVIVGVVVAVISGGRAGPRGRHRRAAHPYPAAIPEHGAGPQQVSAPAEQRLPLPRPVVYASPQGQAGHVRILDDQPTLQLMYHGAAPFDAVTIDRAPLEGAPL
ncbi:DMT family transporter [Streptomyces sp. NPDC090493]|uniref:DMT family transporter n=1 Tax=Streptomyces sp. NPDC090493 TaxID=3365964 RepID=UPI0038169C82